MGTANGIPPVEFVAPPASRADRMLQLLRWPVGIAALAWCAYPVMSDLWLTPRAIARPVIYIMGRIVQSLVPALVTAISFWVPKAQLGLCLQQARISDGGLEGTTRRHAHLSFRWPELRAARWVRWRGREGLYLKRAAGRGAVLLAAGEGFVGALEIIRRCAPRTAWDASLPYSALSLIFPSSRPAWVASSADHLPSTHDSAAHPRSD